MPPELHKETKEARDRYDAALKVIRDCKSQYYTRELNALSENDEYSSLCVL